MPAQSRPGIKCHLWRACPAPARLPSPPAPGPSDREKRPLKKKETFYEFSLLPPTRISENLHSDLPLPPRSAPLTPTSLVTRPHPPLPPPSDSRSDCISQAQMPAAPGSHPAHRQLLELTRCRQPCAWHCPVAWQPDPRAGRAKRRFGAWWWRASILQIGRAHV